MPFFQGASSFNVNGSSFNDIKGDMHQTVNNTKHIIKDSYNSSNATYNDSFNNSSQSHQYGPSPGTVFGPPPGTQFGPNNGSPNHSYYGPNSSGSPPPSITPNTGHPFNGHNPHASQPHRPPPVPHAPGIPPSQQNLLPPAVDGGSQYISGSFNNTNKTHQNSNNDHSTTHVNNYVGGPGTFSPPHSNADYGNSSPPAHSTTPQFPPPHPKLNPPHGQAVPTNQPVHQQSVPPPSHEQINAPLPQGYPHTQSSPAKIQSTDGPEKTEPSSGGASTSPDPEKEKVTDPEEELFSGVDNAATHGHGEESKKKKSSSRKSIFKPWTWCSGSDGGMVSD